MHLKIRGLFTATTLLLGFLFVFSPHSAVALEFNANEFWFFLDEDMQCDYPDMVFSVKNNNDIPAVIKCSYQQLTGDGVSINVLFEWSSKELTPGEAATNHYSIIAASNYSVTAEVEIRITETVESTGGNTLVSGGGFSNKITFYGEEEAALLDLKINDQSDKPREVLIDLKFRPEAGLQFTSIMIVNSSSLEDYFPLGEYLLHVTDLSSGVDHTELFNLSGDLIKTIKLQLIGFKSLDLINAGKAVGVNASIFNHVEPLSGITLKADLYREGELIVTSGDYSFPGLPVITSFDIVIWFPAVELKSGQYTVKGYLYSQNQLVATSEQQINLNIDIKKPDDPVILVAMLGVIFLGLFVSGYMLLEIKRRRVSQ